MTIRIEHHEVNCTCSYCNKKEEHPLHNGLNIPKRWNKPNSWYVLKYNGHYIRWTMRWLFQPSSLLHLFKRRPKVVCSNFSGEDCCSTEE